MSEELCSFLIARNDLTHSEFYGASFDFIMVLLSKAIRPITIADFVNVLSKSVSCKVEYDRASNEKFYYAVMQYIQDFILMFRILAEDNLKNVPPVNDRKYGLVAIFGSVPKSIQ
jgi:hypothetical protein